MAWEKTHVFASGYDIPSIMTVLIALRMGSARLLLLSWMFLWCEVFTRAILRLPISSKFPELLCFTWDTTPSPLFLFSPTTPLLLWGWTRYVIYQMWFFFFRNHNQWLCASCNPPASHHYHWWRWTTEEWWGAWTSCLLMWICYKGFDTLLLPLFIFSCFVLKQLYSY